jgi:hypothetical protein
MGIDRGGQTVRPVSSLWARAQGSWLNLPRSFHGDIKNESPVAWRRPSVTQGANAAEIARSEDAPDRPLNHEGDPAAGPLGN